MARVNAAPEDQRTSDATPCSRTNAKKFLQTGQLELTKDLRLDVRICSYHWLGLSSRSESTRCAHSRVGRTRYRRFRI